MGGDAEQNLREDINRVIRLLLSMESGQVGQILKAPILVWYCKWNGNCSATCAVVKSSVPWQTEFLHIIYRYPKIKAIWQQSINLIFKVVLFLLKYV